eukprot:TRINITY_DN55734_c0_g1_i1.p1 TRINITY_DN55734_c0_g1~~TRINITY_DN55734_c0_g1_i1.p1  ORF type:complete len:218 (-),score=28.51 TRINITY_DN55734_c0_g1_i1:23-676(-)
MGTTACSPVACSAAERKMKEHMADANLPMPSFPACTLSECDDEVMIDYMLLNASSQGNVAAINQALQAGANIEVRTPLVIRTANQVDSNATHEGMQEVLVIDGVGDEVRQNKTLVRGNGMTPLMRAAKEGYLSACTLLLERRATPHSCDEDCMTPLHFAAESGSRQLCELLLAKGSEAWIKDDSDRHARDCVPSELLLTQKSREEWDSVFGPRPVQK